MKHEEKKKPVKKIQFEADSMIVYQPRYTDAKKTRIKALVRVPTGQIIEMEGSKEDRKSTLIRDVFAQYSEEDLEIFTAREGEIMEQKRKIDQQSLEDRRRDEEREVTFQAKTKALEIPEVSNCGDKRITQGIRRAKSPFEVAGWLAVVFMKSLGEKDS